MSKVEYTSGISGKVVEKITTNNDVMNCRISIHFTDKTTMDFELHPTVTITPELMSWKTGSERMVKHWPVTVAG